mmetsp:Transcript_2189/g.5033  ORF Transcript_2189/g.5033 Transcript_2189/m.5033 type:complete len:134 (+) Transcript_2189:2430-2831(+)
MIRQRNQMGQLPIHLACNGSSTLQPEIVEALVEADPTTLLVEEGTCTQSSGNARTAYAMVLQPSASSNSNGTDDDDKTRRLLEQHLIKVVQQVDQALYETVASLPTEILRDHVLPFAVTDLGQLPKDCLSPKA